MSLTNEFFIDRQKKIRTIGQLTEHIYMWGRKDGERIMKGKVESAFQSAAEQFIKNI